LSASVSDAGAAAKTSVASKSETGLNESQIAARGTATPDRPRFSAVNLQQAASVQSSSNASNVTTMAVEGLESKAAVQQNTGLQAAGLSVFQAMQRQDEPLKMEIATPITQPGFTEELQETVKLVSTRDLREVEVTINPEELGPIKLKVQMTGDKADVTFQADNEQTRTLLAEAVSGLTESLAESGIDLRNATVEKPPQSLENNTTNLFQGQGNREQRNSDANFQQGQNRSGRQDSTNPGSDNAPKQSAETPSRRSNGLLDTYA
jgi:flagellar hook-length control protein FliK